MSVTAIAPLAVLALVHRAERRLDRWSVDSQLRARRNAMVAATQLAQLRAERDEVEDYFAALPAAEVRTVVR
jgi:phage portal protein BeeE